MMTQVGVEQSVTTQIGSCIQLPKSNMQQKIQEKRGKEKKEQK